MPPKSGSANERHEMSNRHELLRRAVRDSVLLILLLGIPAAVFANSISDALRGKRPDWSYITLAALIILVIVSGRVIVGLLSQLRATGTVRIEEEGNLGNSMTLGKAIRNARKEVDFMGIAAKRSVGEDELKRVLAARVGTTFRLRFLLLNPDSPAFIARAVEEHESPDTWRLELAATIDRLRRYRAAYQLDIQVKLSSSFPVWRLILIDDEQAWINVFLPEHRGTESPQHKFDAVLPDMAYGFARMFQAAWEECSNEVTI